MVLPWVPTVVVGERLPADPVLVDQNGARLRWSRFKGEAFAVAFIYTRCREAAECPATSAKFAELQRELPPAAHLLEVTIDPAYDTPAVLRRYGEMFGENPARWTLATGDPQTVLSLAKRFNVLVAPGREPGQLEHGEAIAVFDAQERLVSLTAGNSWQPREILAELQSAGGQHASLLDRVTLSFRNFGVACGAALTLNDRWSRPLAALILIALFGLIAGTSFVLLRALRSL
ncbi:MAG TPA: SCO family protein [Candidatus Baltobacteraceae bacterium]|nr:SCO family protein [Candidatus Baltobacteraceae bacterium]